MHNIGILILLSLMLQGCLPTVFGATAGTAIAASKDRSIGGAIDDATIAAKIKKDFVSEGFRELYTKIDVEVMNGRVMYAGSVKTEEDILKAVEIAWKPNGVREVINELHVDEKSSYFDAAQYSRDSWITSQIKARTIMHRDIKFVNYTVVTLKNIVYLFGIARSEEEVEKVANIAAETKGVEKVISHVKLREFEAEEPKESAKKVEREE